MYLINVSESQGINLDYLTDWSDQPERRDFDGCTWPATLVLAMVTASENEYGQRQPREVRLTGTARETMLHWLRQLAVHEDWQLAYEEIRAESRHVCARLREENKELAWEVERLNNTLAQLKDEHEHLTTEAAQRTARELTFDR